VAHRCLNTPETAVRHSHQNPAASHRCLKTPETAVCHSWGLPAGARDWVADADQPRGA
jgi:hypothetical protein